MRKTAVNEEWREEWWEDLKLHARIRDVNEAVREYEIRELSAKDEEGWLFSFWSDDALDYTRELEKSIKLVSGSIKWDGCSHNYFGESGYIHGCGGARDLARLGEVFKRLFAMIKKDTPPFFH